MILQYLFLQFLYSLHSWWIVHLVYIGAFYFLLAPCQAKELFSTVFDTDYLGFSLRNIKRNNKFMQYYTSNNAIVGTLAFKLCHIKIILWFYIFICIEIFAMPIWFWYRIWFDKTYFFDACCFLLSFIEERNRIQNQWEYRSSITLLLLSKNH